MTFNTLLRVASVPVAGTGVLFDTAVTKRSIQVNPDSNGFSGTLLIEGSNVATPSATDWTTLVTLTYRTHTSNVIFDMYTNTAWMRARVTAATLGSVSVYNVV